MKYSPFSSTNFIFCGEFSVPGKLGNATPIGMESKSPRQKSQLKELAVDKLLSMFIFCKGQIVSLLVKLFGGHCARFFSVEKIINIPQMIMVNFLILVLISCSKIRVCI